MVVRIQAAPAGAACAGASAVSATKNVLAPLTLSTNRRLGAVPVVCTVNTVWRGMFTSDPRVAVSGAWPSISTRTSPSRTANHSRVSGWKRGPCVVPGAAATYSPASRPSSNSRSRQLASPRCAAFTSASLIHGFTPAG